MTNPTMRGVHKTEENNKKKIPRDKNLDKILKDYIGQYDGTQDVEDSDDEGARDNHTPPEGLIRKIYAKGKEYWYDLNLPRRIQKEPLQVLVTKVTKLRKITTPKK